MLTDKFRDSASDRINLTYTFDRSLSLEIPQNEIKKSATIRDLLLADDCVLNACPKTDLQSIVNKLFKSMTDFGLTIITKKTEVLCLPASGKAYSDPSIKINRK